MINQRVFYIPLFLIFFAVCTTSAFAGTGQIFSPSGLPTSSTQSYTPPTPGNTPTVIFSTPPLPLGPEVLQGFSGSTLPLSGTGEQKPGGATTAPTTTTTPQPAPTAPENNSIESFFQLNPAPPPKKKSSALKTPGKFLWHILDNIGVPMFVGKDDDLDPSLRGAYVLPPPAAPTKNTTPIKPQRIPESELEGTDDTSPKNDQTLPLH